MMCYKNGPRGDSRLSISCHVILSGLAMLSDVSHSSGAVLAILSTGYLDIRQMTFLRRRHTIFQVESEKFKKSPYSVYCLSC